MSPKSITALAIVLLVSGCIQPTGPLAGRAVQRTGAPSLSVERIESKPHLSARVDVTPKSFVYGDSIADVVAVSAYVTNEDSHVTLENGHILVTIDPLGRPRPPVFELSDVVNTLAPGQTWRGYIELPGERLFRPGKYRFVVSVVGHNVQSPPAILFVVLSGSGPAREVQGIEPASALPVTDTHTRTVCPIDMAVSMAVARAERGFPR